jgi:hypothetical protein
VLKNQFAMICQETYTKFVNFDWVELSQIEYILMHNAFQKSDPKEFSLTDKELRAIFDTISIGRQVFDDCPQIPNLRPLNHKA